MRQLYDERIVLQKQAEEIKRLEWLDRHINHSYKLKNRHDAEMRKPRSKSAHKRVFTKTGEYQNNTNTFARSTVHWDEKYGLLESEKKKAKHVD